MSQQPQQFVAGRPANMYTIESTVTRLLVATKQLLESLTQWSRREASEQDVSDIYVSLGNEFNIACRAFLSSGVEVADLGDVPQALRVILEKALSEDASQESLDKYLPSIRDIIVTLLRQLKQKQMLIRSQAQASSTAASNTHPILQRSLTSPRGSSPVSQTLPPGPSLQHQQQLQQHQQQLSLSNVNGTPTSPPSSGMVTSSSTPAFPSTSDYNNQSFAYNSSTQNSQQGIPLRSNSESQQIQPSARFSGRPEPSGAAAARVPQPPPRNAQHSPTHATFPADVSGPTKPSYAQHIRNKSSITGSRTEFDPAILPRKDPLSVLQRGEALERRASRRFSAYQFAKLTNGTSSRSDIPDVPPFPGGSGSPNLGFGGMSVSGTQRGYPISPSMPNFATHLSPQQPQPQLQTSKQTPNPAQSQQQQPQKQPQTGSQFLPTKTPRSTQLAEYTSSTMLVSDGNEIPGVIPASGSQPASSTSSNQSIVPPPIASSSTLPPQQRPAPQPGVVTPSRSVSAPTGRPPSMIQQESLTPVLPQSENDVQLEETSDSGAGNFVLFLQLGRSVKKCFVSPQDLTISALRLLFIDKFAYPMSSSEAVPDIYIQDPKSGIRYELDEEALANDVHSGSLLSLNIEAVDEVKKHIDEGFATLTRQISEINDKVSAHGSSIQKINEMQESIANQSSVKSPIGSVSQASSPTLPGIPKKFGAKPRILTKSLRTASMPITDSLRQMDDLRRDVASVKQESKDTISQIRETITSLVAKAKLLQSTDTLPPAGDSSRAFMERCFKKLTSDSDKLLTDVDDLQDIIEDLRKDVAQRGVRPQPSRLGNVSKDIATAKASLDTFSKYILSEKAGWKKIWERELDKICEEQQILKFHEEILLDLTDDLAKAEETFNLVQQCSTEAVKNSSFRQVYLPPPIEGQSVVHAKDAVLSEVVALQPNHERRLEAIERAEKMRKRELQSRGIVPDLVIKEVEEMPEEFKVKKKPTDDGTTTKKKKKKGTDEEKKKKKKKTKKKAKEEAEGSKEEAEEEGSDSEDDEEPKKENELAPPATPPPQSFVHASSIAPPVLDTMETSTSSPVIVENSDSVSTITNSPLSSPARQKVKSLLIDSSEDLPNSGSAKDPAGIPASNDLTNASTQSQTVQLSSPASETSSTSSNTYFQASGEGTSSPTEISSDTGHGRGLSVGDIGGSELATFHSATSSPHESIVMPLSTSQGNSPEQLVRSTSKHQASITGVIEGDAETDPGTPTLTSSEIVPPGNGQNPFAY